ALMMRRMVQASLCGTLVWFGVMQVGGGGLAWQNKAVQAAGNASEFRSITYQYEAKSLLAKPRGQSGAASTTNDIATQDERHQGKTDEGNDAGGLDTEEERDSIGASSATNEGGYAAAATGSNVGTGGEKDEEGTHGEKSTAVPAADGGAAAKPEEGTHGEKSTAGAVADGGAAKPEEGKPSGKPTASPAIDGQAAVTASKVVYLTFDDGPSRHTPEVLRILKREGVTATFFLLGEQVERQPELVKQIVAEGHAIGNHTYDHVYEELYGSFRNFAEQIMRTDDAIYAASGIRTTLVRAPGGTYSNFDRGYFDAMKAAGYRVHDWNVDSGDSKRALVPATEIIANIRGSKIANTLNVLMHDSVGHAETVKALPDIISYYKKLGYTFAALNEKVEPMQFQLAGKSKWSRVAVAEADKTTLAAFASRLNRGTGSSRQSGPDLIVHRGEDTLELDRSEYELVNGSIHVPLGKLSEWLGGTAALDEKEGVIEVTLEGRQWYWLADSFPQKPGVEERLDVPIRATLAQFGMEIEDYEFTTERREVWIQE
ncbi:MAG: polysaccharide deacetylase, partial [Paenibacillus sp.]|nr:polysaccharide deacetylase [Paenibacillus sp.]